MARAGGEPEGRGDLGAICAPCSTRSPGSPPRSTGALRTASSSKPASTGTGSSGGLPTGGYGACTAASTRSGIAHRRHTPTSWPRSSQAVRARSRAIARLPTSSGSCAANRHARRSRFRRRPGGADPRSWCTESRRSRHATPRNGRASRSPSRGRCSISRCICRRPNSTAPAMRRGSATGRHRSTCGRASRATRRRTRREAAALSGRRRHPQRARGRLPGAARCA